MAARKKAEASVERIDGQPLEPGEDGWVHGELVGVGPPNVTRLQAWPKPILDRDGNPKRKPAGE